MTVMPAPRSSRTRRLAAIDKRVHWHPFTQMADWVREVPSPVIAIKRGKGIYLYDTDGNKYIDGVSSLWCNLLGHRHPAITRAMKHQLDTVAHTTFLGLTHPPALQ